MQWADITTAGMVILAFFGAVEIVGGGVKVIKEWVNPVNKLDKRVTDLEQRGDASEEQYKQLDTILNAQSKLLIEITNHMITGNDVDKLKEKRDELTDSLIGE
jgi:hypothetical protein